MTAHGHSGILGQYYSVKKEAGRLQNLTDLNTLRDLARRHGVAPSKGFGQNFIVNPAVCPKICEAAGVGPGSNVLEIGPGFGTLTRELAARAKKVLAVEIDRGLLPVLEETLSGFDNVAVVQGDVLKTDLAALLAQHFDGPAQVCANLPYYITSPAVMKLLEERLPLTSLTVMVQKEAADRLAAPPGSREAGAVSYAVSYYAEAKRCFLVKPGSFYPPPKVTSAVIRLEVRPHTALEGQPRREARLFRLIRGGFSQRRKTLANAAAVGGEVDKAALLAALRALGLDERSRPEQLTLEDYIALEATLWPDSET